MSFAITSLIVLYVFLAGLLLLFIIGARLWWQVKAVVIVASLFFFITSYQTIDSLLGRPTTRQPAPESVYIAAVVKTPNRLIGSSGEIVVWIRDQDGFRLHNFPYTKKLHSIITKARKMRGRGATVIVRIKEKKKNRRGFTKGYEFEVVEKTFTSPPKPRPGIDQGAGPGVSIVPVPGPGSVPDSIPDQHPGDQGP